MNLQIGLAQGVKLSYKQRVLILGTDRQAYEVGGLISKKFQNVEVIGYINLHSEPVQVPSSALIETQNSLLNTVKLFAADKLILCESHPDRPLPIAEFMQCKTQGIDVIMVEDFYEQLTGKIRVEGLKKNWLMVTKVFRLSSIEYKIKRTVDILISLLGLIVTLPFLPFIALAIKLDSQGPVFYRQLRVGRTGTFSIIKFRTMSWNAEISRGPQWAKKNDPRITRCGRLLRCSRLDELPQMINVLAGHMSLVGPRPERPNFVQLLSDEIPFYSDRLIMKPGLTGWAQVSYHYGCNIDDAKEKLAFDLYYIKNYSILFDLYILLKTVNVVLLRKGAH